MGFGMLGIEGRRNKQRWSGKGDGVGGEKAMVKKELCEKLVEVRRESGREMAVVVDIAEDMLRLICGYARNSGRKTVFL